MSRQDSALESDPAWAFHRALVADANRAGILFNNAEIITRQGRTIRGVITDDHALALVAYAGDEEPEYRAISIITSLESLASREIFFREIAEFQIGPPLCRDNWCVGDSTEFREQLDRIIQKAEAREDWRREIDPECPEPSSLWPEWMPAFAIDD